jgi:L-amino acid N-acyltransferase YncA
VIVLRKATTKDCRFLFDLHVDPTVRKFSRQPEPFTLKHHKEWFENILQQPEQHLYVAMRNGRRVGSGRLSPTGVGFQVSYAVCLKYRGKKVGRGIVEQLVLEAEALQGRGGKLYATVRADNLASLRSLVSGGFELGENSAWIQLLR